MVMGSISYLLRLSLYFLAIR